MTKGQEIVKTWVAAVDPYAQLPNAPERTTISERGGHGEGSTTYDLRALAVLIDEAIADMRGELRYRVDRAQAQVAEEREACARAADSCRSRGAGDDPCCWSIAAAIRARGSKP